jgi:hypothetical protein
MLASFFGSFHGFGMGGWHLDYPKFAVILTFRLKVVAPLVDRRVPRLCSRSLSTDE